MIRNKTDKELIIDLSGPDGNSYYMLQLARQLCHKTGDNWQTVCSEMTSGDYEELLLTFDSYFGDLVILER